MINGPRAVTRVHVGRCRCEKRHVIIWFRDANGADIAQAIMERDQALLIADDIVHQVAELTDCTTTEVVGHA